jgi:putative glycosyltransferase (TIGR04372 family)
LHNREDGYTKNKIPDLNSDFRNGSIDNYLSTIQFILSIGGAVVRMGDSTMTPFPNIPGLIDYAHSQLKSEMNDLLLSGNCRFFLGNTSGAHQMASAQGIPVVGVNLAAMGFCKFGSPNDIGVPKLYIKQGTNEPVPFKKIFDSGLANFYETQMFYEAGVYLKETPQDEILEAVKQMIDQLNGKLQDSISDIELQTKFNSLFNNTNYSFYSRTKISSYFLRKHQDLLLEYL